jgi:hypothetical protein
MLSEIVYWLIALFTVAGFFGVGSLIARINRFLNNRRIQRGIAEYLLQKAAARS